jgi:hypothetical protein
MMELHAQSSLGHTITDTILIVNELLEIFQRTTNIVAQVPEARLYHAVRGSYVGLIAALAAERYQSKFIFLDSLDPGDDLAPFWLNALPHHWHSSLANSPLYRQLGERILMLTREILFRHSVSFLTPFPNQIDQDASHVSVVGPGLLPRENYTARTKHESSLTIGWLMPTITLTMLDTLDRVLTHVADLSGNWKLRLIEAAPHRRDWVCDLDAWLLDHPVVAQCFKEAIAYHPAELDKIDFLVALPGTAPTDQDAETGSEEAAWIVLQTISASIPLLATHALRDWFWDKEAPGIFVSNGRDAKEAASALRTLAKSSQERANFAQTAERITGAQFSRNAVVKTLSTLYTESLADRIRHRPTGISQRSTASNWGVTNP